MSFINHRQFFFPRSETISYRHKQRQPPIYFEGGRKSHRHYHGRTVKFRGRPSRITIVVIYYTSRRRGWPHIDRFIFYAYYNIIYYYLIMVWPASGIRKAALNVRDLLSSTKTYTLTVQIKVSKYVLRSKCVLVLFDGGNHFSHTQGARTTRQINHYRFISSFTRKIRKSWYSVRVSKRTLRPGKKKQLALVRFLS